MKLWIGDHMADAGHLTRADQGSCLLLMMAMWRTGGRLPNDPRRLAVLDTTQRSEVVLRRFSFPLADFRAAIPGFDPAHLRSVRFDFDRSPRGAIVLDDVGLHGATAPRAAPWPTPGNGTRSKPQP